MWALRAVSTDPVNKPRVFGLGKMVIYANVTAGTTLFYLARIDAIHAGKTMVIELFDPGDAAGNSQIEILKPTTMGYVASTFSYTADATAAGSKSGTIVSSLKTTIGGAGQYNNSWVTLTVPFSKTYTAPLPASEPAGTQGGWWKIRYSFDNITTDTTTWQASIRGNPVHLVLLNRTRPAWPNGTSRWYFRRVGPTAGPRWSGEGPAGTGPPPDIAEEPDSAWRWSSTTAARGAGSSSSWASSWRSWPAARRSFLISQAQQQAAPAGAPTVGIVVATRHIPPRKPIKAADVAVRQVPLDATNAQGVFADPTKVVGLVLGVAILAGQPIYANFLASQTQGGQFSILGPSEVVNAASPAWRAVSVTVPDDRAVAGMVHAGDTVDVFVTVSVVLPDDVVKAGKYYTDKSTKITYQDVLILAKAGTFYVLKVTAAVGEEISHLQASGARRSASPCARRTTPGWSTRRVRCDHPR